MPRQLTPAMPLDTLEEHVIFTRAALAADPDAADLLPLTDGWLPLVDPVRELDRRLRTEVAQSDALRSVCNARLDAACITFGDELYGATGKDRGAARWTRFFPQSVTRFVRQGLERQVNTVKGWLGTTTPDAVLDKYRVPLARWADAAGAALVTWRGLSARRGELWERREALASALTRERDGLRDALAQRARDRGFERAWPDAFFRVDAERRPDADAPPDAPAASRPEPA